MTGKDVVRRIRDLGGEVLRQSGSHVRIRLDTCQTTVPVHAGRDLPPGTLRAIERQLAPCVGRARWLT
ncbi:MAG TPA: type II toxin-antitoxin system HicA family toxin [Actinomycetes bacterium]|nr:type II toxin-antitoxin system HicA family toxin [Actinomycetes bacterium]